MEKVNISYLKNIVYSDKAMEDKYYDLIQAAKLAKDQGFSRKETAELFESLWDLDDDTVNALDGYISTVLDMILGYCIEEKRIWAGVWENRKGC